MAFHSHQPIGNFDQVFEEATQKAYDPFLTVLEAHPLIKVSLHYSGCLLDWLRERKPHFIRRIAALVARGSVELLGGGYYEPILPIIPEEDRLGQLARMSRFLKETFGVEPKGAWLAERVWEPSLAKTFSEGGFSYTIMDDTHFKLGGLSERDLIGFFMTEESGKAIRIFPASEKLRYLIPFKEPQETVDHFRSLVSSGGSDVLQVFADDGEKFGLWPETEQWVYGEKWLERFFRVLEENRDWIVLKTFSEILQERLPQGMVYLPCASYREMLEWSGGYFRNFFVKYPEGNRLHKRMLWASQKLREIDQRPKTEDPPLKNKTLVEEARTHLYKAQCNCAYWHGIFGGLYLGHLRSTLYHHLIESEKAMEAARYPSKTPWLEAQCVDFDQDGREEIIVSTSRYTLFLDPGRGGSLFELDDKEKGINLINTLSRRKEAYHEKLLKQEFQKAEQSLAPVSIHEAVKVKEPHLEKLLAYDWYPRVCLLDHFLDEGVTVEEFAKAAFEEKGSFINAPYRSRVEKTKGGLHVLLEREGEVGKGEDSRKVRLQKVIRPNEKDASLAVTYTIQNLSSHLLEGKFGVEFNFSVWDPQWVRTGEKGECREFSLQDEWYGFPLSFTFSTPFRLWHFPVETVSDSEQGLEHNYQELGLLFHRPTLFEGGDTLTFDLLLKWGR